VGLLLTLTPPQGGRHDVDHHDGVVEVQCHHLELDAPVVLTGPAQASVRGSGRRHVVGHDGIDHEHRVGLDSDALVADTLTQILQRPLQVQTACLTTAIITDLTADLRKIKQPVLVVHGDADTSAPLPITGNPPPNSSPTQNCSSTQAHRTGCTSPRRTGSAPTCSPSWTTPETHHVRDHQPLT